MSFSQNDEERYVLQYAGKSGCFLDVGAHDGVSLSNTHALALRGWKGVCVEPAPYPAAKLIKTYPNEDQVTIIEAALGTEHGMVALWASDAFVSTTEHAFMVKWSEASVYRKIFVHQVTWHDLELLGPYDMVNLDTEGTSLELFDAMPQTMKDRARVLVVEHNGNFDDLHVPAGYEEIYRSAENVVLINSELAVVASDQREGNRETVRSAQPSQGCSYPRHKKAYTRKK